jgi:hypothetical protein
VRSRIRSRSNSARAAKTWKTSVPERSAEAVQFPDDQGVAGPQLVEDLLEGGPVGPGAAGGLGEDSVAAGALQGVDLELWLLIGGGKISRRPGSGRDQFVLGSATFGAVPPVLA